MPRKKPPKYSPVELLWKIAHSFTVPLDEPPTKHTMAIAGLLVEHGYLSADDQGRLVLPPDQDEEER